MRTSLELPDSLLLRAKRVALERGTTLKALVASGLEKELGLYPSAESERLSEAPIRLSEDSPLYHSPLIDEPETEKDEAAKLNEVYRRR